VGGLSTEELFALFRLPPPRTVEAAA